MSEIIHEATGKMTQLCKKVVHVNIRWSILDKVSIFRRFFRFIWGRILVCSIGRPVHYRRLKTNSPVLVVDGDGETLPEEEHRRMMICNGHETDSDLVSLKISLLGDCQIGKTSFLVKYVGDEQEKSLEMTGLNLVNKTLVVQGARIAFSIWDVGGDSNSLDHLPIACKDAVAILFMFDLTSRCTLNRLVQNLFFNWYKVLQLIVFFADISKFFLLLLDFAVLLDGIAKQESGIRQQFQ
ncbi:hypothetical protein PTKIN_Ptkin11bG0172700 [Pterospermum kingtungense]